MRMMLVGAGAVGESMLKILKWRDPKGEWLSYVLVGDYDASRAQEVVDLLADERFSYAQINATDKEQMKDRCPGAEFVGTGSIENYELQFKGSLHGAHATIAPKEGSSVPVGMWTI